MTISLRDLTAKDTFSMREVAADRGFSYLPVSQRELVTPQLQFGHDAFPTGDEDVPDTRPGSHADESSDVDPAGQSPLDSTENVEWQNWLEDHTESSTTRLEPSTKTELRKAMVNVLDVDGGDAEIRSVGSGHSHSKAAQPASTFVDLTQLRNESGTLDHGPGEHGWLAVDEDETDPGGETYIRGSPKHGGATRKSNLARLKGGTMLKRLNRDILPSLGDTGGDSPGKALVNMGAWDGQTIAGAVNTGTHGTGVELGSVADVVRSVEIATVPEAESGVPIVQLYRIEPDDGITDREAFEADAGDHEMQLIQDDEVFHSVVVGYGCMGNVFHYTMEVRDAYWIQEWPKLRNLRSSGHSDRGTSLLDDITTTKTEPPLSNGFLTKDPETGADTRHLKLLVNLPAVQGKDNSEDGPIGIDTEDPICLEIRHRETEPRSRPDWWERSPEFGEINIGDVRWPPERPINVGRDVSKELFNIPHPLGEGARKRANWAKTLRNNFFMGRTDGVPTSGDGPFVGNRWETASYIALRRLRDRKNYPPAPPQDAISTAVAVPLDQLADAVERVLDAAVSMRTTFDGEDWNVFFPVPLGVRFVEGTHHHLSAEFQDAEHPEPRAMVELPFPVPSFDRQPRIGSTDYPSLTAADVRDDIAKPALARIQDVLVEEFDGRPHMGKHFTLDGDELASLYPKFRGDGGWMETYRRFNAFGTFNNGFTEQLGISVDGGSLPDPPTIGDSSVDPDAVDDSEPPATEETPATAPGTEDDQDLAEGTDAAGPGFGALTGLFGVAGGAWLSHRYRGDESEETTAAEGDDAVDEDVVE